MHPLYVVPILKISHDAQLHPRHWSKAPIRLCLLRIQLASFTVRTGGWLVEIVIEGEQMRRFPRKFVGGMGEMPRLTERVDW